INCIYSNSYPERWRDWPLDTSATDCYSTVPTPEAESLQIRREIAKVPKPLLYKKGLLLLHDQIQGGEQNEKTYFRTTFTRWSSHCWGRLFIRIRAKRLFTGRVFRSRSCTG